MRSQMQIIEQTNARKTFFTIILYLTIFSIGLAFGEAITQQTIEAKVLCYKYFNTTNYRKVSNKIQCKIKPGYFLVISQSQVNLYQRLK